MALKALQCIEIHCGKVRVIDYTGTYDAVTNDGGYGAPNPDFGVTTPYTVSFWPPGATEAAYTLDLYEAPPAPDYNGEYWWEVPKETLGYGDGKNLPSGAWKAVVTLGTEVKELELFSVSDLEKRVEACTCGAEEYAVMELTLIAIRRMFCCGDTAKATEMVDQMYKDTACCCGC